MFALFRAIAMMVAIMAKDTWTATWKFADGVWRTAWSWLPGGSSVGATPQPLDLPSQEVFDVDRSFAESQQRAADIMANENSARQVKIYASANADDRYAVDLSKLEPTQQEWLTTLSMDEKAMRTLSEAYETKIAMLLAGHDNAVEGIEAPKLKKTKEVIPGLVSRIDDFRIKSASRERNHVFAA